MPQVKMISIFIYFDRLFFIFTYIAANLMLNLTSL